MSAWWGHSLLCHHIGVLDVHVPFTSKDSYHYLFSGIERWEARAKGTPFSTQLLIHHFFHSLGLARGFVPKPLIYARRPSLS